MFDVNMFIAVVAVFGLVVFIRIALTLKDISASLAALAGEGGKPTQVKVDVALPRIDAAEETKQEPDETEIAAVIAVAKAALEGAL